MKMFKNFKGFTLVELMVVVAIIGILASVAVPNFRKYQAKSKTSEAKLILTSAFMAETGAYSDYTTYVTCLQAVGFTVDNTVGRYYAIGWNSATAGVGDANWGNTFVSNNFMVGCGGNNLNVAGNADFYAAGKTTPGAGSPVAARTGITTNSGITQSTFTIGASGFISNFSTTITDQWTIDHTKNVLHPIIAY